LQLRGEAAQRMVTIDRDTAMHAQEAAAAFAEAERD
jgi:hypothetical protein